MTSPIPSSKVKRSWKLENEKILGMTFVWLCHRQTKKGKKTSASAFVDALEAYFK